MALLPRLSVPDGGRTDATRGSLAQPVCQASRDITFTFYCAATDRVGPEATAPLSFPPDLARRVDEEENGSRLPAPAPAQAQVTIQSDLSPWLAGLIRLCTE